MKILIMMLLLQAMVSSQVHLYLIKTKAINNVTYSLVNDSTEAYLLERDVMLAKDGDEANEKWIVINPPANFLSRQMKNTKVSVLSDNEAANILSSSKLCLYKRPKIINQNWEVNEKVQVNDERIYNKKLYKCLRDHLTLKNWNPEATVGKLWTEAK